MTGGGERCSWCGETVPTGDGDRAAEPAGERVAAFCRLDHVIPWASQGARWEPGTLGERGALPAEDPAGPCAHCGEPTGDAYVLLVERRAEAQVVNAFCSADHLSAWARGGGAR